MNDNKSWCVYLHTVPKEISGYDYDKYYVGITCQDPKIRWANGYGYKHGYSKNGTAFYNAIQKYGWDNIKHEVIVTNLTQNEAEQIEIQKIKEYKSYVRYGYGYNETLGGNTTVGYKQSQKTKDIISQKAKIRQQSYDVNPLSTPIYQFTDLGVFIKKINSYKDALEECGGLADCLNNKQLVSRGCIWRREEDIEIDKEGNITPINLNYKFNKNAPIYMFDEKCKFEKRFETRMDAYNYLGVSEIDNKSYIPNTVHFSKGYLFRMSIDVELIDNIPHMKDEKIVKELIRNKKIYAFDANTKIIITTLDTCNDVANYANCTLSSARYHIIPNTPPIKNIYFRRGVNVGFNDGGEAYFIA